MNKTTVSYSARRAIDL